VAALFGEIERRTVAQTIIDQVKGLILQGKLSAGQKLPSERELAGQLGVGRSSVREATSAMLAMGIIEIRPGEGAFIRDDFPQSTLESVDWSSLMLNHASNDLFEARTAIEVNTAKLAALRATPRALDRLHRIVDQFAQAADLEAFVALDLEFHLALAEASQNMVLHDIIAGIQNLMRSSMLQVLRSDRMRRLSLEQHRVLYDAVARGAAKEAAQAMRAHLEKDLDFFNGVRERQEP
jgi:GntR family transcriptional repressor for pyruvate dehydrogenase complex